MLIEEIVNQSILEKNKKRSSKATSFWVSSAYSCNRKRFYGRKNEPKSNLPNIRALRTFHVGNMFHAWIQDEMRKMAKGFEIEFYLRDKKTFGSEISGLIDCIARFNGKNILYDFKSINSRAFKFLATKKYGASPSHVLQVATYYLILKTTKEKEIDEVRLVYVDKDSLKIKEMPIPMTKKIIKATEDDWAECIAYWKKKELPPAKPKEAWECSYCNFKDTCKKAK